MNAVNPEIQPEDLERLIHRNYDNRLHVCKEYLKFRKIKETIKKEQALRNKHPQLEELYKQYKMLLALLEEK